MRIFAINSFNFNQKKSYQQNYDYKNSLGFKGIEQKLAQEPFIIPKGIFSKAGIKIGDILDITPKGERVIIKKKVPVDKSIPKVLQRKVSSSGYIIIPDKILDLAKINKKALLNVYLNDKKIIISEKPQWGAKYQSTKKLNEINQLLLNREIRNELNIKKGDYLNIMAHNGEIILSKDEIKTDIKLLQSMKANIDSSGKIHFPNEIYTLANIRKNDLLKIDIERDTIGLGNKLTLTKAPEDASAGLLTQPINKKGEIKIPHFIRQELDLKSGDNFRIIIRNGKIVLWKEETQVQS